MRNVWLLLFIIPFINCKTKVKFLNQRKLLEQVWSQLSIMKLSNKIFDYPPYILLKKLSYIR